MPGMLGRLEIKGLIERHLRHVNAHECMSGQHILCMNTLILNACATLRILSLAKSALTCEKA